METLYRKVAVSDIEKLMEDSLTTKKRGGEYRTALNHVLNISQDLDVEADKEELLEALENLIEDEQLSSEAMENEIKSLIQKNKQ